jgi:hypothetical protein
MSGSKIAIAGGGMVAGYAAKQLVEIGLKSLPAVGSSIIVNGCVDVYAPTVRPRICRAPLPARSVPRAA